jgi:hypothetical protein
VIVVPEMLPESAAVEAQADALSIACPVRELPFCKIATVPVKVSPNLVDVPVICQPPVRLAPGATATVTVTDAVPVAAV